MQAVLKPSETYGNFDLVRRVKLDFTDVVVSKWRSRVTGLSIVHLDYEGHTYFPQAKSQLKELLL